jgi:enoyl-CoA hydratase/carnithine racemase
MIDVTVAESCAVVTATDYSPLTRHDAAFAVALATTIVDLSDNDDVKVIVLRASGPDFASDAQTPPSPDLRGTVTGWARDFSASDSIYQALCFSKKVTITEVAGRCVGAGSALVLATDLTIASQDACFGSPFMDVPESNFVLASLTMRLNRAKAWAVRGRDIPAPEAMEIGLVSRVVTRDHLSSVTAQTAATAAEIPLDGIVMSKMLLQSVMDAHGVGREFDMANLYATSQRAARLEDEGVTR